MAAERLSFKAWQSLVKADPEQAVRKFFSRYQHLTPESRKALFATHPGPDVLREKFEVGSTIKNSPLAGVPYVLQDLFDAEDLPTRCGAPFGDPFAAPLEESCLLAQALDNCGASLLAKCVPSEFGWDMRGHNASFGDCPHFEGLGYVCGGGSGSCAHAVAGGWAPIAFGLDTCGGIRIPAAFHGLFGFRMENNSFARHGVFPIVPSLDSVGCLTANIDDLLSGFKLFYQPEPEDATPRGYLLNESFQQVSTDTKAGLLQLIRPLDVDDEPSINKTVSESFYLAARAFETIQNRELYSVHGNWIEEYGKLYDPHLAKEIKKGRSYGPTESDEACIVQQNLRESLIRFFEEYDYLIVPVSPLPSPEKTDWDTTLEEEILELNAPLSLSFLPALILPFRCGGGKFNAAQFIFNPRKLHIVPKLLEQVAHTYASY